MSLNLFILVTIFCWGIWGIADKKALLCADQMEVIVCLYLVTIAIIPAAFIALILTPGWQLSTTTIFWTGLAAATYGSAIFAYMEAMNRTEASYVLGITASYPLILQILATIFLKEQLVPQRLFGALIITAGLFFVGGSADTKTSGVMSGQDTNGDEKKKSKWKLWTSVALATLAWGVYGLFDKKALEAGTPLEVYVSQRLWDTVVLAAILLFLNLKKKKLKMRNKGLWTYCGLSGATLAVGGLCYLEALKVATASYVITITGCYPLLMYLFALLLLKEKFNKVRFLGIVLIVAGGIAVQLTAA